MLDFVLSKMSWLIASVLVLSFVVGLYQVQNDAIDDRLLYNTGEEINRVIRSLDIMEGEATVNFTFDSYDSYRAIYLPETIGGRAYKMTFYDSFVQIESGNSDAGLHYGTSVQPLMGGRTDATLDELLAAPKATFVNRLVVYSGQDFSVSSKSIDGGETHTLFVHLNTKTVYHNPDDEDGLELLYGDSDPPGISRIYHEPSEIKMDEASEVPPVTLTALVPGDHLNRVTAGIRHPDGTMSSVRLQADNPDVEDSGYSAGLSYRDIGTYSCELWAEDVFGRRAVSWYNFTITDSVVPEITNLNIEPAYQNHTLPVFINFTASDNHALENVKITVTKPGGQSTTNTVTFSSDGRYHYVYDPIGKPAGYYSFSIRAVDISGNEAVSSGGFDLV